MEASNLSDSEFKVMVIIGYNQSNGCMLLILNSIKKDIETMKKNQPEIKNIP